MIRRLIALLTVVGALSVAGAQQSGPPAPASQAADAEREARDALLLARVRLELTLARKALSAGREVEAARRALRARELIRTLAGRIDAQPEALQAEGIVARARQAGVDVDALAKQTGQPIASAESQGQQAVPAQADLTHQKQVQQRVAQDRVRMLHAADEVQIVPLGEISYPPDWPARIARRARYRGGQIARSASWIDDEGRERYAAIYDIHDLIYVPPDFQPPFSLVLPEQLRNELDREALRQRSQIFNGYAEDLAAGIPLLRFFGGVDDFEYRGPKYSTERQKHIAEMIRAFTQRSNESKIILVPPGP